MTRPVKPVLTILRIMVCRSAIRDPAGAAVSRRIVASPEASWFETREEALLTMRV
jgi:hypothetical protein